MLWLIVAFYMDECDWFQVHFVRSKKPTLEEARNIANIHTGGEYKSELIQLDVCELAIDNPEGLYGRTIFSASIGE